jgi:PST family polysaccharide transporter
VVIALAVNFFLMAQLSLQLTGISWLDFARAHYAGVGLAAVCTPVAVGVAYVLRPIAPAPVVAAGVALGTGLAVLVILRVAPRRFLGEDGVWMSDTLLAYVRARTGKNRRVKAPIATTVPVIGQTQ